MNECYLLLRNNKETGPYSLTGLLQLSLTANDLVWVQGKSAGWRYPFEVDELKGIVTDDTQPALPIANKKEEVIAAGLQKEQKKVSKKVFVSLPSGATKQALSITPSFEEKAEALRQKALNFSQEENEVSEVKYARSLNDIKEEYSGWIQEQKKGQKHLRVSAPLAYSALFVAITATAFFVLQWSPKKQKPVQATVSAANKIASSTQAGANNTAAYKQVQNKPENEAHQPLKQKPAEKAFALKITKPSTLKPALPASPKTKEHPSGSLPKDAMPRQKETDIPITDLIETTSQYIQSKEGIGLSIGLHNKSNKSIRVAAIDVIYFNKEKVQTGKETLYFSNVHPGSTLTKKSSFVKAASASYSIGLVSAENAGLYVMQ